MGMSDIDEKKFIAIFNEIFKSFTAKVAFSYDSKTKTEKRIAKLDIVCELNRRTRYIYVLIKKLEIENSEPKDSFSRLFDKADKKDIPLVKIAYPQYINQESVKWRTEVNNAIANHLKMEHIQKVIKMKIGTCTNFKILKVSL